MVSTWAQSENTHAGCSKRLSSKAAASEEARRTLRYVDPLSDARTLLADFFSILLQFDRHQVPPNHNLSPERFPCLFPHIVPLGDRIEVR